MQITLKKNRFYIPNILADQRFKTLEKKMPMRQNPSPVALFNIAIYMLC